MSENLCSICASRPSAIRGICRYCYALNKRPQPTPAVVVDAVEETSVAAVNPQEPPSAGQDEPAAPKRRRRKKAD